MSDQPDVQQPASRISTHLQSTAPVLLLVAVAGLLSGVFAAYAYYQEMLNGFGHAVTPWLLLVAVVSTRQRARQAALRSVVGMVAAVAAFYLGIPAFYSVNYPDAPPISVNADKMVLWCVLAVFAGAALGAAFSKIGSSGRSGAVATAGAVALLLVATFTEVGFAPHVYNLALLGFTLCAVLVVLWLADTSATQRKQIAALLLPLTLASFALVAAPDVVEQLVFFGF